MKVLIIPEDQTHDGFIIRPIVEAIFTDLGIPARVDVLPEPRLRGATDALNEDIVAGIINDNPMTDCFILVVDRDCDRQGHVAKAGERRAEHPGKLVTCVAIQEVEVWMLALHKDELSADWHEVRGYCDPKEKWAEPLLAKLGAAGPGGGRKRAMAKLKGRLRSLLSLCDELAALKDELRSTSAHRSSPA